MKLSSSRRTPALRATSLVVELEDRHLLHIDLIARRSHTHDLAAMSAFHKEAHRKQIAIPNHLDRLDPAIREGRPEGAVEVDNPLPVDGASRPRQAVNRDVLCVEVEMRLVLAIESPTACSTRVVSGISLSLLRARDSRDPSAE